MNQAALLFVTGIFFLLHATASPAEISIDELIRDAGIVEGPIAMRDLPHWNGAHKLIIFRMGDEVDAVKELLPNAEFVVVNSEAEAIQKASDVDAIIGLCSARSAGGREKCRLDSDFFIRSRTLRRCSGRSQRPGRTDEYAKDVGPGNRRACRCHDARPGAAPSRVCEGHEARGLDEEFRARRPQ